MSDYDIVVDSEESYNSVVYDVGIEPEKEYTLNVGYQIPAKAVQYTNLLLDNISSFFNGTDQIFPLTVNGEPYFPINEQQLIVSINDVVLNPGVDYSISESIIYFTNPPSFGSEFFGVALVTTADLTRTINVVLDNGSFDIRPGTTGYLNIDVTGTIESWILVSDTVGSIVIDVRKTRYDMFPNGFVSIVGSEYPILTDNNKNRDEDLKTWDTKIKPGDILDFNVLSCTGIQKCSIFLRLQL
jgi:hypothetical protein